MCGQLSQTEIKEKDGQLSMNLSIKDRWTKFKEHHNLTSYSNHRLIPGMVGQIVVNEDGVVPARFAYYSEMTNKKGEVKKRYQFNTRCEGGFANKANDPYYEGPWQIFSNPFVAQDVVSRRCVVPAQLFVEAEEGSNDKYIIEKLDGSTMYIGAIYIESKDKSDNLVNHHFNICTLPYSSITYAIGHLRSPLEIPVNRIDEWLSPELSENEIISFFNIADGRNYQAYRAHDFISMKKKDAIPEWPKEDPRWIEPQGDIIKVDSELL